MKNDLYEIYFLIFVYLFIIFNEKFRKILKKCDFDDNFPQKQ